MPCMACGILVLPSGIKPRPCAVEAQVLTTGPPGNSLNKTTEKKKKKKTTEIKTTKFYIYIQGYFSTLFQVVTHTYIINMMGTSLLVQWLRLCLIMQGVWVRYLVGEVRPHMPLGQKIKT